MPGSGRLPAAAALRPLVGDLRQVASVRRIVLDDGAERGVRALAFSTGGGLDFWVLTDRSFDIGPLWLHGLPLAWQGPNGFRSPTLHDSEGDAGHGFQRSFSGFLVTCGLEHIRQPDAGHPLHGRLPFTPGRLTAYGEDWERGAPVLFCEGEMTQARRDGEMLRLHRRIEAPVGGTSLAIEDRVESLAEEPQRHDLLYHFNLGYPAFSDATRILVEDRKVALAGQTVMVKCMPLTGAGSCRITSPLGGGELVLCFEQSVSTLPFLQIWRDPRPRRNILGIEPCTSDRLPDGRSAAGPLLAAGEIRHYAVRVDLAGS